MNTCATCKHWRRIRDEDFENWPGPHGECGLFDEDSQEQAAWVAGIMVAPEDSDLMTEPEDLSLITRPEFGCNQWEKLENETNVQTMLGIQI